MSLPPPGVPSGALGSRVPATTGGAERGGGRRQRPRSFEPPYPLGGEAGCTGPKRRGEEHGRPNCGPSGRARYSPERPARTACAPPSPPRAPRAAGACGGGWGQWAETSGAGVGPGPAGALEGGFRGPHPGPPP